MLDQFLSWMKLPKKLAWSLVIVTAVLLWGSSNFVEGLGLKDFINEYRKWFGIIFLFFLVVGLQDVGFYVFKFFKERYEKYRFAQWEKNQLKNLTPREKEILNHYIENDVRSIDLSIQDGEVSKLIKDGFIYVE